MECPMKRILTAVLYVSLFGALPAMAESDWAEFCTDSQVGVTFYYSPGSVGHSGSYATAKWHDTNHPELVFTAQIDCPARTIQNLAVDRFDQNGSYIETVDLSNQASPQPLGPDYAMGSKLAQAIC
jgi:lipopolysaccharide export LptBFGC system permease protein LptF